MKFQQATNNYIATLSKPRRRGFLSANSVRLYTAYATKLAAHFGSGDLADVKNGRVKAFVDELRAQNLSASTIVGIAFVLKQIIASVQTDDGESIYTQKLNANFLALPVIEAKEQTCASAGDVEKAIAYGLPVVALLAASGLRISECLALTINGDEDSYCPETGRFFWRARRGSATPGSEAGSWQTHGYRTISVDNRRYLAHRLAWLYVYGRHPIAVIDILLEFFRTQHREHEVREEEERDDAADPVENGHDGSLAPRCARRVGAGRRRARSRAA